MIERETPPLHVAVVEDDHSTREALARLVHGTPGFACLGGWATVEAMLGVALPEPPDVILLDIQLPGMSGIEGIEPLRRLYPRATILMLTVFDDEQKVFQALCAGAHGYLLKNTAPGKLLDAIREAEAGGSPMSPEIARMVVRLFREKASPRDDEHDLSPQEVRLLGLLAEGHSYQSAADEMIVSINTVRNYIRSVYDKLHVHSKSAAVAEALRAGLI